MNTSLFERLGGTEGITKMASSLVENHLANPTISTRFKNGKMSADTLKNAVATFLLVSIFQRLINADTFSSFQEK